MHLTIELLIFIEKFKKMQRTFSVARTSRNTIAKFLDNYTLEQLNTIPEGFNNNIIWNIGHIVVVQQMIIYNLSDLPMMVSREMIDKFKKGTRPEDGVTQQQVDEIRELLFTTIEKTEDDWKNGIFKHYREFTSASGFQMQSAQDAIEFNNYHEAMHTGVMMSIRKFV